MKLVQPWQKETNHRSNEEKADVPNMQVVDTTPMAHHSIQFVIGQWEPLVQRFLQVHRQAGKADVNHRCSKYAAQARTEDEMEISLWTPASALRAGYIVRPDRKFRSADEYI